MKCAVYISYVAVLVFAAGSSLAALGAAKEAVPRATVSARATKWTITGSAEEKTSDGEKASDTEPTKSNTSVSGGAVGIALLSESDGSPCTFFGFFPSSRCKKSGFGGLWVEASGGSSRQLQTGLVMTGLELGFKRGSGETRWCESLRLGVGSGFAKSDEVARVILAGQLGATVGIEAFSAGGSRFFFGVEGGMLRSAKTVRDQPTFSPESYLGILLTFTL